MISTCCVSSQIQQTAGRLKSHTFCNTLQNQLNHSFQLTQTQKCQIRNQNYTAVQSWKPEVARSIKVDTKPHEYQTRNQNYPSKVLFLQLQCYGQSSNSLKKQLHNFHQHFTQGSCITSINISLQYNSTTQWAVHSQHNCTTSTISILLKAQLSKYHWAFH
jgi:hypothetical protein